MPEQIEVEAIKDARDWESPDGQRKLTFYVLDVKRANGDSVEVDHARKQGGQEPQPGETFEAIFEPGKYRQKLKKAPKEGGFKGGGARSPQVQAEITRQHSQGLAVQVLLHEMGERPNEAQIMQLKHHLPSWADFFDADVRQAGERVVEGVAFAPKAATPGRDVAPQPSSAQDSDKPSLKQLEFLEKLAKENGIQDTDLGVLTEWANQTLTPGREGTCSEVIDNLKREGVPEAERLKETSQNWANQRSEIPADTKGLGEQPNPDDSIPF